MLRTYKSPGFYEPSSNKNYNNCKNKTETKKLLFFTSQEVWTKNL